MKSYKETFKVNEKKSMDFSDIVKVLEKVMVELDMEHRMAKKRSKMKWDIGMPDRREYMYVAEMIYSAISNIKKSVASLNATM